MIHAMHALGLQAGLISIFNGINRKIDDHHRRGFHVSQQIVNDTYYACSWTSTWTHFNTTNCKSDDHHRRGVHCLLLPFTDQIGNRAC